MFRTSIIFLALSLISSFSYASKSCDGLMQAYNEYTQKVQGQIVKKHSIFEVTEWSRNSRFQGLVLTEKVPKNAEVVLEIKAGPKAKSKISKTTKTTPFQQDTKYRVVDLNLDKEFSSAPAASGAFIVRVLVDGKELCAEKKSIYDDGD